METSATEAARAAVEEGEEVQCQETGVDDLRLEALLRSGGKDGGDRDAQSEGGEASESAGSEDSESSEGSGAASDSEGQPTASSSETSTSTSTMPRGRLATDSQRLLVGKHAPGEVGLGVGGASKDELRHLPRADAQSITAINRLLKAKRLRSKYERRILRLMSSLKLDGNTVVKLMDLPTAFARFRDHHGRRGLNYTHLLAYFSDFHARELSVFSKARLVECACYSKKRRQRSARELFILRLFESCTPAELSELKLRLQSSIINLSRILDQHVKDRQLRDHLYTTIAEKAQQYLAQTDGPPQLHVLSDIDDTFVHSGIGLGGPKYPNKTVLPGALALLHALDARVAFVTARPVFVERYTFRALQKMGITASVLCGQLSDSLLIPFAPSFCNTRISSTKVRNVVRYSALFPECRFVWFGDSGQGDVLTALELLQTSQRKQEDDEDDDEEEEEEVDDDDDDDDDGGGGGGDNDGETVGADEARRRAAVEKSRVDSSNDGGVESSTGSRGCRGDSSQNRAGKQEGTTNSSSSAYSTRSDHCRGEQEEAEATGAHVKIHRHRRLKRKCSRRFGGHLVAAYIQDVVLDDGLTFKTSAQERARLASHGVHVVDNYIAVALHMYQEHGLLTAEQLRDVTLCAVADVKAVADKFQRAAARQARFSEHRAQVVAVNKVLKGQGLPEVCFDETDPTCSARRKQLQTIVDGFSLASSA